MPYDSDDDASFGWVQRRSSVPLDPPVDRWEQAADTAASQMGETLEAELGNTPRYRIYTDDGSSYLIRERDEIYEPEFVIRIEQDPKLTLDECVEWLQSEAEHGNYTALIPVYEKMRVLLVAIDEAYALQVMRAMVRKGGFLP